MRRFGVYLAAESGISVLIYAFELVEVGSSPFIIQQIRCGHQDLNSLGNTSCSGLPRRRVCNGFQSYGFCLRCYRRRARRVAQVVPAARVPQPPAYIKSPLYWIVTILMVLAGGFLAYVQGVVGSKPLLALNIGISAPLILKSLAAAVPSQPTSKGIEEALAPRPSVLDFVAGR